MFTGAKLTQLGQALLAKVIANNKPLTISKMALGDGTYTGDYEAVTSLVSEKMRTDIENITNDDNVSMVRSTFSNEALESGFYVREIGIFAVDPDTSALILYAYDNVGSDDCDYLQAAGNVVVKEVVEEAVSFGNASSIQLTVNPSYVFVTMEEYNTLQAAVQEEVVTRTQQINSLNNTKVDKTAIVHNAEVTDSTKVPGMDLIHDMQEQLDTENNNLTKLFQFESIKLSQVTIDAGSFQGFIVPFTIPSGYVKLSTNIFCSNSWYGAFSWADWGMTTAENTLIIRNFDSVQKSLDVYVHVVYIKNIFI